MVVDVRAQPVRVGDVRIRARGDEQALRAQPVIGKGPAGVMAIKREAALETASQLGEARDPAAVRREVIAVVQAVAPREALEREVGERRARLADREARVRAALEQDDVVPLYGQDPREQGARERRADDCHEHKPQLNAGSAAPVTVRGVSRAARAPRQALQPGSRSTSQRSAVTTAGEATDWSIASSSWQSVGALKSPRCCSRSSSPLPPRTGMMATRPAPRAAACSTVLTVHSTACSARTYGTPSSTNTRRSI